MKCTCKQCGKEFELTQSEIDFYTSKKLSLPKRCKECREKNKRATHQDANHNFQGNSYNHKNHNGRKKYSFVTILIIACIIIASYFGPRLFSPNEIDSTNDSPTTVTRSQYVFQSEEKLQEHYEKHGIAMGFASAEEYQKAAAAVVTNPNVLKKTESEDGDAVYYVEDTNEFVIISTTGYIRTYFNPEDGMDYYDRQ